MGIIHILVGLGYDFIKVEFASAENTSKINEMIRLEEWL